MADPDTHIPGVLALHEPRGDALPLMFDSPHSGNLYPDDFAHDCPRDKIRWGEDAFIDEVYAEAPDHGAWLLAAEFPRTYIDPNRALEDMDPGMVDGPWPGDVHDNPKSAEGIGLIWANAGAGVAFYDSKLAVDHVQARIENYWRPYHRHLEQVAETILARWGRRWHINCHSMYSEAFAETLERRDVPAEDIVLGSRDGTCCGPEFVAVIGDAFRAEGLSVAVNKTFKGVELVRKLGDPAAGCHSLQIEIDRRLYMDEWAIEKNSGFDELHAAVSRVVAAAAAYVRSETES